MKNLIKPGRIIAVLLFLMVIILLFWVRGSYYQWYDPDLSLPLQMDAETYKPDSMVLYLDVNCPCNLLSSSHIETLRLENLHKITQYIWLDRNQWSEQRAIKLASQYSLDPENIVPAPVYWQRVVQKTPTVILFNRDGSMAYFGPVSSGLSCNTSTSFIDQLLENLVSNIRVEGLINSQVKGCFCDRE